MPAISVSRFAWLCAATILVSAFLLFQVQPLISKTILPWFGGGPAVWTTCMLFFQILLMGGYAYAHWLVAAGNTKRQVWLHVILLICALAMLPIIPKDTWKPLDGNNPTGRILMLLGATVAIPYFLLSSTGPLVQRWFSRACPGRSPYRLYSLSNVGSLGALLSYPFFFEPIFRTKVQGWLWSGGFAAFALLSGGLALALWRNGVSLNKEDDFQEDATVPVAELAYDNQSPLLDRVMWLLLPACGSIALLAVTNHLCQDVAVVPFMWIAPLALYLLTFIICFDNPRWYWRPGFAVATAISIGASTLLMCHERVTTFFQSGNAADLLKKLGIPALLSKRGVNIDLADLHDDIRIYAGVFLVTLFLICMLCHGELVRRRPSYQYLTSFYLMTAAGGALGGIFVALICPRIFSGFHELNLTFGVGYLIAALVLIHETFNGNAVTGSNRKKVFQLAMYLQSLIVFGSFVFIVAGQMRSAQLAGLEVKRNFYGVLRVEDDEMGTDQVPVGRQLLNGRILHGYQLLEEGKKTEPTTYYTIDSGVGLAISEYPRQKNRRVGVVGLGAGTLATYGKEGDVFRFYEINPQVALFASKYFTFLKDSAAECEIVYGDARLSMEREKPQNYDVLVLDAFTGDAIPVHLLTEQALTTYRRHLNPEGILAIHISNRHLDLLPVVVGLARQKQMRATLVKDPVSNGSIECPSDWVLVTNNEEFLNSDAVQEKGEEKGAEFKGAKVWTDDFSNLFDILK